MSKKAAAKETKVARGALRNATVAITDVKLGQGAAQRFQGERFEAALAEVSDTALTGIMTLHNAKARSITTNKDGKTDLACEFNVRIAAALPSVAIRAVLMGAAIDRIAKTRVERVRRLVMVDSMRVRVVGR